MAKRPTKTKCIKPRDIDVAVAACAFNVTTDGALQLTPWGEFKARDGRPVAAGNWYVDERNADRLLATLRAKLDDLVIDYEHQTLHAEKNGKPAPAAGWFSGAAIEARPGEGLFVVPRWTAAAKSAIAGDEYRYFSPVLEYNKKTGEVYDIQMGALVNFAAIDGMREVSALAAAKFLNDSHNHEELPMDELLRLFGLSPEATEEEAIAALKSLLQKLSDSEAAVAAAKAETPDSAMAAISGLQTEVAALRSQLEGDEVDSLVNAALEDGRLIPAMEGWARDHAKTAGVAALKSYLNAAQPLAALKGQQSADKDLDKENNDKRLGDEDLAVCKAMNIDPDEYRKQMEAN